MRDQACFLQIDVRIVASSHQAMITSRRILSEALCRLGRRLARACPWRHDGAAIAGGKRGLSSAISILLALLALVGAVRDANAAFPNGDFNGDGINSDRPHAPADSIKRRGFTQQEFLSGVFRTTDFPRPAVGQFGNLARNAFRAPGFARIDGALQKNFPVWRERVTANLRLESFNATNRVNLNAPSTNLNSNDFGRVTNADGARTYQASLLIRF